MYYFKIYLQSSVYGRVVSLLLLTVQLPIVNSSLEDLFQMVEDESYAIGMLQKFIEIQNKRLKELEVYTDMSLEHAKTYANEDEFAWNPLAIYKTIKHLTVDLENVKMDMKKKDLDGVRKNLAEESTIEFDERILQDSICDLAHLQKVYNVSVTDMIEGHLAPNLTIKPDLTPEDCFLIGKILHKNYDMRTAVDWLQGCYDKFDDVVQTQASEIILSSALILGNKSLSRTALMTCINKHHPDRLLYVGNLTLLSRKLNIWQNETSLRDKVKGFLACSKNYHDQLVHRNLKCRYVHHNLPFLTIAPLKEEVLSFLPRVSLFQDAVYDSEIEQLKADAYNKFHIVLFKFQNKLLVNRSLRPAQGAPLLNTDYVPLRNRLEDLSSISLKNDEGFEMVKYAPGGFFQIHRDFRTAGDAYLKDFGNRFATAILYLNDVTLGGYTAFPYLRLRIPPVKGSILFWMNIKADGSEEPLVKHVACPVIYGEKTSKSFMRTNFTTFIVAFLDKGVIRVYAR